MIRVPVIDVLQQEGQQYIVMFLQKEAQKVMGIWVGFLEGLTIAWLANGAPWVWAGSRRPLTFNLLGKILLENGIFLRDVQIVSQEKEVFYALTRLRTPAGDHDLDCRPSDAVALALQMKRPIFVDPEVMDAVTWKVSDVYKGKAAPGEVMKMFPEALETMWQEKDSRAVSNVALKTNLTPGTADESAPRVQLSIADVQEKDEMSSVVVLMDQDGIISLPILMSSWEAYFLASLVDDRLEVHNPDYPPRPSTIDYVVNLLTACDISVEEAAIQSERDGILHASVTIRAGDQQMTLDARPFDAIFMALKFELPIYANASVMESAGLSWRKLYRSRESIGQGMKKIARKSRVETDQPTLVGRLKSIFWKD